MIIIKVYFKKYYYHHIDYLDQKLIFRQYLEISLWIFELEMN